MMPLSLVLSFVLFLCTPLPGVRSFGPEQQCYNRAVVVVQMDGTGPNNNGYVEFCETADENNYIYVLIQYALRGLTPGQHAVHIHASGDLRNGCASIDPGNQGHLKQFGDLGNVDVDSQGNANYQTYDETITLSDEYSIIGRGFVIHENPDGSANNPTLACGVIGSLNDAGFVSAKTKGNRRPKGTAKKVKTITK